MDFFGDFGLRDTFQERIWPKSIEMQIDTNKLRMKFSALDVDFDGSSLDFLGSRKPAHEGIKERYPCKSRYFTVVGHEVFTLSSKRPAIYVYFEYICWTFAGSCKHSISFS